MKSLIHWMCVVGSSFTFPVEVSSKVCTGGYHCSPPHECCTQGCCLYVPSSGYNPHNVENQYVLNPTIKYYLWLALLIFVLIVGLVWVCKARGGWRGWLRSCNCRGVCFGGPPASEPDSAGSCYYPPQYSRCGSLCRPGAQPPPPPYNEVASKPDLYPMVIYLGADKSDGDYMVQYFKNYIVRPPGSLSAASTADSLSSSFLCNTANEANSIIPPPYSCAGAMEWSCAPASSAQRQALLRSISSVTCHEDDQPVSRRNLQHSNSVQIRTSDNDNSESITHNNFHNCQIAQTSGNSHRVMPTRVHSMSSVSNNPHAEKSIIYSSARIYSEETNGTTSSSNRQYLNMWDYNTDSRSTNSNTYNINDNYSPKRVSPRLQKYLKSISSESLEENNQSEIYTNYTDQESPPLSPNKSNLNTNNITTNYHGNHSKDKPSPSCVNEVKRCNVDRKGREYSFLGSTCERNTSIGNLNSLEENQICSFFSHSVAEATTNDNISSDYSIFTKNLNNFGSKEEISRMYSVGNSMTGSEISSLANLGTPDSPPRATSPTSEIKELLDKIQQLPNQASDENAEESFFISDINKTKRYFSKARKNSLYMPLNLVPNSKTFHPGKVSPTSSSCFMRQFSRKGWLSRSAPTTPSGNGMVPNILSIPQRNSTTTTGRTLKLSKGSLRSQPDESPLLTEQDTFADETEN